MAKAIFYWGLAIAAIPLGFLMEALFPAGDWRWGIVALLCVLPGLIAYRREIWRFILGKRLAASPVQPAPSPPPERPRMHVPVATTDGRKTAEYILCAPNLSKAAELYDYFKVKIPAESRASDHFVNKAYLRRLEKGGDADGAKAFYRDVASKDADNIRDDIEFAEIVERAEGELIEKARRYLSSEIKRMEDYRNGLLVHFPPEPEGFGKELSDTKSELRDLENYIERLNNARR